LSHEIAMSKAAAACGETLFCRTVLDL
jgi:hypothetical protein